MTSIWPWLVVAGLGALHGLSPANGWMFVAACGVRARDDAQARRALLPIAIGHAASVAVVACVVAQGLAFDRALFQSLAGALLVGAASYRLVRGAEPWVPDQPRASPIGLMATAHGTGLMLVPALVPLCLSDTPGRDITASGSLVLALAAVGVHTAAMLMTTGLIAAGVCRGLAAQRRCLSGTAPRQVWTAALAVTGVVLMA
jgi:hypothetical protein